MYPLDVPACVLGESPRWHDDQLTWVDILEGSVHTWRPGRPVATTSWPDVVSASVPRSNGGSLVAVGARVLAVDPDGTNRTLAVIDDDPTIRCNEGVVGPDGAFYVGTMRRDVTGRAGKLVRVDPDGSVELLLTNIGISNGIGWSPDGERTYYVDTLDFCIDVLELDTGKRELFTRVEGRPDGLTVDASGDIWLADWDGARVLRYSADSTLRDELSVPAFQTSACVFGGPDLTTLFVTTAQEGLGPEKLRERPATGLVFARDMAGQGLPQPAFAG